MTARKAKSIASLTPTADEYFADRVVANLEMLADADGRWPPARTRRPRLEV